MRLTNPGFSRVLHERPDYTKIYTRLMRILFVNILIVLEIMVTFKLSTFLILHVGVIVKEEKNKK